MAKLYAGAEWIGPAYPDNYLQGRQGQAVVGIVDHHSASTLAGLIQRFTTSSGVSGGGVSAHFAIDRDGTRYQIVDTDDTAFHAGNFPVNLTTVGIEHIRLWGSGPGTAGFEPITDEQYISSHELHVILAADRGFPLDLDHVHPHNAYSQTTCPGDLDLARIITPEADLTPDEHQMLVDVKAALGGPGAPVITQLQTISKWLGYVQGQPDPTVGADIKAILAKPLGSVDLTEVLGLLKKIDGHFTGK